MERVAGLGRAPRSGGGGEGNLLLRARIGIGYLAPNTRGTSVTLSLILVVMAIVDIEVPGVWGSLMLVELYKDLH